MIAVTARRMVMTLLAWLVCIAAAETVLHLLIGMGAGGWPLNVLALGIGCPAYDVGRRVWKWSKP